VIALRAMAVPARSPARPPSASILWVAGRGSGPVPRPGNAGTQIEEAGFSLIEALVALAVLAIATVGLIRAVESHIDSTRAMERRAAAMWVAENRLAEIQLADPAANASETDLLGQQWKVEIARTRTEDAGIDRVRIQVFAAGERSPLASLDGFVEGSRT